MKCADIPAEVFMAAVTATLPMSPGGCWRHRRDVHANLELLLGTPVPVKVFLAKARKLGAQGILEGCTRCTCRGDYHTPRECHLYGCCYSPEHDWRQDPRYDPAWEADERPAYDPGVFTRLLDEAIAMVPAPDLARVGGLAPFDLWATSRLLYPAASPARRR